MECRSCKMEVNDEASKCPYCGDDHPQPYSGAEIALMIGVGIGGVLGFLLGLPFFIIGGIIGAVIGGVIGAMIIGLPLAIIVKLVEWYRIYSRNH